MLSVGQQPTTPAISFQNCLIFRARSRTTRKIGNMDRFFSDNMTTLGIALILSIAIIGAFRAGQVLERSTISKRIHELDLEKLKQKTESKR